jgi:hypothetical protein
MYQCVKFTGILLMCLLLTGCSGCSSQSGGDSSWTDPGNGYEEPGYGEPVDIIDYNETIPPLEEQKNEIVEPDAERIKWDLQGQTLDNPLSGRYLRKITILRKEDITNLKIVSKDKDVNQDYVNYRITATIKGEGYCTYIADLDIAYNVREISGSKVTKGWVYYWTKVQKIDVATANNNFKSCLESRLIDRNLMLKNTCTNAIIVEGSILYSDRPQNFYRVLEAGGTDSIVDIKDYKIEKVFRP